MTSMIDDPTGDVASASRVAPSPDELHVQHELVDALRAAAPPRFRWHLCCPTCRLVGHRGNCRDCRDGGREDFAAPMAGDFIGRGES